MMQALLSDTYGHLKTVLGANSKRTTMCSLGVDLTCA
jgi:hypothetical protein